MAILNNNPLVGASGNQGGYNINNSLRFRSSASAYLNRTPASTTNRQTWTWSGWVKRGALGARQHIFVSANPVVNTSGQQEFQFAFNSSDQIEITGGVSGVGQDLNLTTTQVFRDPSAWYHFVVAIDTTQATSSNRMKFYVNGVQVTAFGTAIYPAQNHNTAVNLINFSHRIGGSGGSYLDGYLTEVNFIDGQALTPSSFGETDTTTGVWKPKAYSSTYGTNGFYLKFSDIATTSGSNTGLGRDFSGNGNFWNTNNISVTAGATYDAMTDVPTLTSATVANYAVMNPLWRDGTTVIAQGNLDVSNGNYGGFSTLTIPTNSRFYAEFTVTATQGNQGVGLLRASAAYSGVISQTDMFGSNAVTYYSTNGNRFVLGGGSTAYGSSWGTIGDVIGIAVNTVDNQITFYKNNTSQGVITGLTSGIEWVFATGNQTNTGGGAWNFGQRPFAYTPPTGFNRLNTFNLPTSTIVKGNTVMDATLYTGNGSTNNIVNAGGFRPDFVWGKDRAQAQSHLLFDSVRGVHNFLVSNSTSAESTNNTTLTAFNSNGFQLGTNGTLNQSGISFVGWQWQAGQGSTSSNTSGSITSTVSANTTAGFSIVTYTGTGANATVGHGLGVAPAMMIFKQRNAVRGWPVYHRSLGASTTIYLNVSNASNADSTIFNSTSPTSSVFSVGASADTNASAGTYVAYCWASIAGFSSFGSYTGNGSADGPFVYLGFRPKFVLVKASTSAEAWYINDSARDTFNPDLRILAPNLSDAEFNNGSTWMDLTSNGFKIRYNTAPFNTNAATYIVAAWAENPFKNSLAR